MFGDADTITAIATAKGLGALAVVRVSGPHTQAIVSKCFQSKTYDFSQSHRASFGLWCQPDNNEVVDEVVVINYASGRGYTGESAAEILCHGGDQMADLVLGSILNAGARLARPGEFTYRAVMNERLDLVQAENVLEVIHAKSPKAAALALKNLRGALSSQIEKIENEIIYLLAHLEASIDFTTEDIQPVNLAEMRQRTERLAVEVKTLLEGYVAGQVIQRGLRVALVGPPNSGKSSLLNAVLGRKRSIVSALPGTTRDTIEAELLFDGHLVRLIDTAGLHETENEIEREGVELSKQEISSSDILVYVIDVSLGLANDDVARLRQLDRSRVIVCFNKSDLGLARSFSSVESHISQFGLNEFDYVLTSALCESGTHELKSKLIEKLPRVNDAETTSIVSTHRQQEVLSQVFVCLETSAKLMAGSKSPELISFELQQAMVRVKEILGKDVTDDIMDRVFKEFCIGK